MGFVEISIVWHDEVAESQSSAEPDWLSQHIYLHDDFWPDTIDRQQLTDALTAAFAGEGSSNAS